MIGAADERIRRAAFAWLTDQREERGESLSRTDLVNSFKVDGVRISLMGPSGIWKPAQCELPLSVTTVFNGPYLDVFDDTAGAIDYAYRREGPSHRDNRGLSRARAERVPVIYFHAVDRGRYAAAYPAFVVGEDPTAGFFRVQVDDLNASLSDRHGTGLAAAEDETAPRRAYVTRTFKQRLHQVAFRERVISAYRDSCALCRLHHRELLDAAHITPDMHPEGERVVSNGLALCKLHHAAFDRFFFAVRPDYRIEVRPSILAETDGPMLVVGLQQIHGQRIELPARVTQQPDPDRLARRYEDFLQAS